jgi:hypothetical protein
MPNAFDDAVNELYRAPHDQFVAERKRLASELTSAGDKAAGARLSKRRRPTVPAWAVNQLWWSAREPFEKLLEHAARLREGDLDAADAHRKALAALRTRAQKTLTDAGHPANEATLRRITTTLSAIAAAGGFDPDPPGALASEREAPGFDAFGAAAVFVSSKPAAQTSKRHSAQKDEDEDEDEASAAKTRAQKAAAVRLEKERAKKQAAARAAQKRIAASLRSVEARIETQERKVQQLRHELRAAEAKLEAEQSAREQYRSRLADLEIE